MTVKQLNRDQLVSLKQQMLCDRDSNVSYGELAIADDLITDAEVFAEFSGTEFTDEDFF